jgi:hypothetical protein
MLHLNFKLIMKVFLDKIVEEIKIKCCCHLLLSAHIHFKKNLTVLQ